MTERRQRARTAGLLLSLACAAAMAASPAYSQTPAVPDWTGVWYFADPPGPVRMATPPPLTPEYQAIVAQRIQMMMNPPPPSDEPAPAEEACNTPSFPGMMFSMYPFDLIVTPEVVVTLHELDRGMRHIYTDGRPRDSSSEPSPTGESVGRWEGDTLVVETTGLEEGMITPVLPHSDQVRITERIRLVDQDTLQDVMTIEDPKVLREPISLTRTYKRQTNFPILEYTCQDNIRGYESTEE